METRFCIEYVHKRNTLREKGSINVRYDRIFNLEQTVPVLTMI